MQQEIRLESGPQETTNLTIVPPTLDAEKFLQDYASPVLEKNKNLGEMSNDFLYHLGLTKEDAPTFANVKAVVMGGLNNRMTQFAYSLAKSQNLQDSDVQSVGMHKRYVLYLVGNILICSHGIGGPSISILLHEVAKLLKYAGASAFWIRMGTCSGIGVPEGTLVIPSQCINS